MLDLPSNFRRMTSQAIHVAAIPLSFFAFVLIYHPFDLDSQLQLGRLSFGVNLTLVSCVLLGSTLLMRGLFFLLRKRIDRLTYYFWCLLEITVAAFFVGLYVWLMERTATPYFLVVARVYGWIFPVLIYPYVIIALSLFLVARYREDRTEPLDERIHFYDERKNLKLVVNRQALLYIAAEENYVRIHYREGEELKKVVLRSSMRALEPLCATHGLLRCHRSYFLNPTCVKVLRKGSDGQFVADIEGVVQGIPISKRYYESIAHAL